MVSVLVVDDDERLYELLESYLAQNGVGSAHASDGRRALQLLDQGAFDAVLLDIMMPGPDGLSVLRSIREKSRVPVIMLTAKGDETDRVVGLELGADDYLTKPFSPRELVARIRAILRRVDQGAGPEPRLEVGDVELDRATRVVRRAGEVVHLTPTEFDLLACLVAADGAVLTRVELLHAVWGYRDGSGARTVDSHVRALRRKLGEPVIRTVHAVGYAAGSTDA
jgi:DNA-binding response OmpR family regulator